MISKTFHFMENKKEEADFLLPLCISLQHLHDLSAAAGDHIPCLHMQQLVADRAVDVTFLFRTHNTVQTSFQFAFHNISFPVL